MILRHLKHWPRLAALVAAAGLCWLYYKYPETYVDRGELITSITNIMFVLLTYESLRFARESVLSPHITAKFIGVSKVLEYISQYPNEILITQELGSLRSAASQAEAITRNCIFVEIENVGHSQALDIKLKIQYSKKSLGTTRELQWNQITGNLKPDRQRIILIDTFEGATDADEFKLIKCDVEYSDVHKKQTGRKPVHTSPSIDRINNYDRDVVIKMV